MQETTVPREIEALAATFAGPRDADAAVATFDDPTGRENMRQLIQLRWIAVIGQVVTIAMVNFGLGIRLPLREMSVVLLCLIAFNAMSLLHLRSSRDVTNSRLFVSLLVDVGTLTAPLYLSGGITNPFVFLYLLQVILGAILLRAWSVWTIVAISSLSRGPDRLLPPSGACGRRLRIVAGALYQGVAVVFRARRGAAGDLHHAHQPQSARA